MFLVDTSAVIRRKINTETVVKSQCDPKQANSHSNVKRAMNFDNIDDPPATKGEILFINLTNIF